MAYKDYYYILGLTVGASNGQIQAAFNELYEKFGPHVSAEELDPEAMSKAFRDISEAYEVLMDPRRRAEYDKQAMENKQVSNDLRDLWLKKSGLNAAEAAAAQAAEEHNPSSWIKRTATGSNPIYEDDKNSTNAQRSSSARNPAFNPTASSQRNPVFNPRASSQRNPVFDPTASSQRNPVYNPTASAQNPVFDPTASSQRNPVYNPTASNSNNPTYNAAADVHGQEYPSQQPQQYSVDPVGDAYAADTYGTSNYGTTGSGAGSGYSTNGYDSQGYGAGANNYDQHAPNGSYSGTTSALALELELTVTLKEAFKGTTREIVITDPVACHECANMKPVLRMQCTRCRGVGSYNVDRKEEIVLPAGMYDGMEISRPGQGRYDMRAGRNGDVIVKIKLARHALLGVNGRDVTCTVPVTIYEAMLGAEIQAPCATGKVTMKIQPLTQPGRVYRLKGMGLSGADQLVTIEVVLPSRLSGDEVAIYKKLRDSYQEPNPRDKFFQQG